MTYIEDNRYRKPFMFALALHIILFAILIMHFKFSPQPNPVVQNSVNIIKAVTVNQSQLSSQSQNQLPKQLAKLQVAQQQSLHELPTQPPIQQPTQASQQSLQLQKIAQEKVEQQKIEIGRAHV